jgi:hypothetical protein
MNYEIRDLFDMEGIEVESYRGNVCCKAHELAMRVHNPNGRFSISLCVFLTRNLAITY